MRILDSSKRLIAACLALMLAGMHVTPAYAGMMGTAQAIHAEQIQYERQELLRQLERQDVRDQLTALGVSPEEAKSRVGMLTDQQLQEINQRIDQLPAGAGLESILVILLIVFLVFVITDAVGATDIFPFINPPKK